MTRPIRYDPPLVRALAAELHARLAGRAAHGVPLFDRDRSATLLLDRGEALRWELHPARGWPSLGPRPPGPAARPTEARVTRVWSPEDERLVYLDLSEGSRFRGSERRLVVELPTNQWNALLVDRSTRQILSVLRARDAGGRLLRPGERYAPPPPTSRRGRHPADPAALEALWLQELGSLPPGERRPALLRGWADVSPVNVDWILGEAAAGADGVRQAFARWWRIHELSRAQPVLLELDDALQPYPLPLAGIPGRPAASLLEAFAAAAALQPADAGSPEAVQLLPRADRRLAQLQRRLEKLRAEAGQVGAADRLRRLADLLLASLDRVPPGADHVVLPGFEGDEVRVPLDPALRPHQNADALYDRARRLARAEARLPTLIESGEREAERWREGVEALRQGEVPDWIRAPLHAGEGPRQSTGPRLPYRTYRTSGGLEVRVGRSRADNDRLTFQHCGPDDVWLHAREVPGSHVVLRWASADSPPARDLEEAAALAAWHSRARGSGTVAVDWTRRRFVRKPRGAPPGRVALMQAGTLLVQPAARPEAGSEADEPLQG